LSFAQTEREVTITQHSGGEENGFIKIIGEVKNTYQNALASVRIEIEYFDKSGKPLGVDRFTAREAGTMAKDEVMASCDVIAPGETSPFERTRDISKLKGQFGSYKIKAAGFLLKENNTSAVIKSLQSNQEGRGIAKFYRVTGTYTNTGKEPCKNPKVVVAGYDANGKIQVISEMYLTSDGTSRGTPLKQVEAGKSQNFSLLLQDKSNKVTQVKAFPSFSWY
jgi:hypothetical protein